MKISLNWLKKYVDLDNYSVEEIREQLTQLGVEVWAIHQHLFDWEGIIAAKVLSVKPLTKKLSICKVFDGEEKILLCGAPIIHENAIYAFAPIGSRIGTTTLGEKNIMGVTSYGMLCSGIELGFNSVNLLELNSWEFQPGNPLKISKEDWVFTIEVTPNRGHWLNHRSIAKELAASLNLPFNETHYVQMDVLKEYPEINIKIEADTVKSLFFCIAKNTSPSSKLEIQAFLSVIGQKIVNNPVDCCNFTMWDCGQPLHCYDLEKISNCTVRNLELPQTFHGLDGKSYNIPQGCLVFTNDDEIFSLMGFLGSHNTQCTRDTQWILLESGSFDSEYIFRTEQAIKLTTEASYRFARGVPTENNPIGLHWALKYIGITDAKIFNPIVAKEPWNNPIYLSFSEFYNQSRLGLSINEQINILSKTGFQCKMVYVDHGVNKDVGIEVIVPWNKREYISSSLHVIEEILRVYGINKIPRIPMSHTESQYQARYHDIWRSAVAWAGLSEVITLPFYSKTIVQYTDLDHLAINNPISPELSFLRRSLALSLVDKVINSIRFQIKRIGIFEIGEVYFPDYSQQTWIAGAIYNNDYILKIENGVEDIYQSPKVFDIQHIVEKIFANLGINNISFNQLAVLPNYFSPGASAGIEICGELIGALGRIYPIYASKEIFIWELWKIPVLPIKKINNYKSLLPLHEFDISFLISKDELIASLIDFCYSSHDSIESARLLKVFYQGGDKKSVTIRFSTRTEDNQLNVQEIIKIITTKICDQFSCTVK